MLEYIFDFGNKENHFLPISVDSLKSRYYGEERLRGNWLYQTRSASARFQADGMKNYVSPHNYRECVAFERKYHHLNAQYGNEGVGIFVGILFSKVARWPTYLQ